MNIVVLAPQGVQSLDVVGPAVVFWETARRLGDPNAYRVQIMGAIDEPSRGTGALRFLPDRSIHGPRMNPLTRCLSPATRPFRNSPPPSPNGWPVGRRRRAVTVRSAPECSCWQKAGLLENKQVTTDWECADKLRSDYPRLRIDSDQIFIRDGQLSTAGGVTSGIDLALALVEEDHSRDIALIVAR